MFKSIRARLLAWHAGIMLLAVVGFGAALFWQIRRARFDEVDAELLAVARTLEGTLRGFPPYILEGKKEPPPPDRLPPRPGPRNPPPPPRDQPDRRWETLLNLPEGFSRHPIVAEHEIPYFVVWLRTGEVYKTANLPPDYQVPSFESTSMDESERRHMRPPGPERELVIRGPRDSRILVGRSIDRELHDLSWLAGQLFLIGSGVLAIGLTSGFFLVGRVVRPIQAMSATAASISVSNLNQRIDVKEVDSELGQLATILNAMFTRLEAAFERQARFTADASHELRTPLAIIQSHAELALSRPREANEYQHSLTTSLRAARRMKAIVEGLLILARADAGKLETKPETLDLGALVTDTVELLEPLAERKEVTLTVQAQSLPFDGDRMQLSQVITNLVTNAINYNRPKGSVIVSLAVEGNDAVLSVADTGLGIPEADLPHLFERFFRVDKARAREQGGSGLGLAICKSIVDGLGGSIQVTSEVDCGTTFVVRLPRQNS